MRSSGVMTFIGAFAKLRKAAVSFVSHQWTEFYNILLWGSYWNLSRKLKFGYNLTYVQALYLNTCLQLWLVWQFCHREHSKMVCTYPLKSALFLH